MRKLFLSLLATILWLGCVCGGGYLAYQEFIKDQVTIMEDLNTVIGADVPLYYWGETEATTPDEEVGGSEEVGGGEEVGGEETE